MGERHQVTTMRRRWFRDATEGFGLRGIAGLALILYAVFIVVPIGMSLRSSLTDENPLKAGSAFIGLDNYREMAGDAELRASVAYTLALAIGVTLVANAVGLGFAVLLNRTSLSYRVLRTVAFLPQVISGVIVGFVWKTILTQDGLLNDVLVRTGAVAEPVNWLGSTHLAQLSVGIVVAWVLSGFTTVMHLAALQNIPAELYDASAIDGASRRQQFRLITFRMVAPATTIGVTISLITVLKLYDIIAVLTSGGPAYATESTAQYIVKMAFTSDRFGYASAVAMFLLALSAVIALTVTSVLRRREVDL
jgi:ABC-type sugar transport system permease subunit